MRTSQSVSHHSLAFLVPLQNILLHSSNIIFTHYETVKHNISGQEVEKCPLKHLQPTASISKCLTSSRNLISCFYQPQLHLHIGSAVSTPPCLLLCTGLSSFLQRKMRWLFEIPAGYENRLFSVIQIQPHRSPWKREQQFFSSPATDRIIATAYMSFCILILYRFF